MMPSIWEKPHYYFMEVHNCDILTVSALRDWKLRTPQPGYPVTHPKLEQTLVPSDYMSIYTKMQDFAYIYNGEADSSSAFI
jgi:hypothetical protein